jgi:aubergine
LKIPLENTMICGIDTYNEAANKGKTVGAFVSSINSSFTKWYGKPTIQNRNEEMVNGIVVALKLSLAVYKKANNQLPDRILVYRDGVSDSQFKHVENYEITQFKEAFFQFSPNYDPKITFIIVQKRINMKFFKMVQTAKEQDRVVSKIFIFF